MRQPAWIAVTATQTGYILIDSDSRTFPVAPPPPIDDDPRKALTAWPGPGEVPEGLWKMVNEKGEPCGIGRFLLLPGNVRPYWASSQGVMDPGPLEKGDRFEPFEG